MWFVRQLFHALHWRTGFLGQLGVLDCDPDDRCLHRVPTVWIKRNVLPLLSARLSSLPCMYITRHCSYLVAAHHYRVHLQWDPVRHAIVPNSRAAALAYAAFAAVWLWGIMAVIFISPVYIGLGVANTAVVACLIATLHWIRQPQVCVDVWESMLVFLTPLCDSVKLRLSRALQLLRAADELEEINECRDRAREALKVPAVPEETDETAMQTANHSNDAIGASDIAIRVGSSVTRRGASAKDSALDASCDDLEWNVFKLKHRDFTAAVARVTLILRSSSNAASGVARIAGLVSRAPCPCACGDGTDIPPEVSVPVMATVEPLRDALLRVATLAREMDVAFLEHDRFRVYVGMLVVLAAESKRAVAEARFLELVEWCRQQLRTANALQLRGNDQTPLNSDADASENEVKGDLQPSDESEVLEISRCGSRSRWVNAVCHCCDVVQHPPRSGSGCGPVRHRCQAVSVHRLKMASRAPGSTYSHQGAPWCGRVATRLCADSSVSSVDRLCHPQEAAG